MEETQEINSKPFDDKRRLDIINKVKMIVVEEFGSIEIELAFIKSRKREIVEARQVIQTMLSRNTKWSLQYIGKNTGDKDHATVLHSRKQVANYEDTDLVFRERIEAIQRRINLEIKHILDGMRELVILESPYWSIDPNILINNVNYARECLLDSLGRNEAPFASHLIYTQVYNDENEEERMSGLDAATSWYHVADKVVVYLDHNITKGMQRGINLADKMGLEIEYRKLGVEESL